MRMRGVVGWLAVPSILSRRSRAQGLRVRCTLAACGRLRTCDRSAAACRCQVPGNPARSPETIMDNKYYVSLE